jgi:hypothetical protein
MTRLGVRSSTGGRHNPWVGPREFRRGDTLPNRMREAREVTDRVVAERVVLLHSPSGAGKTSLIEAAVVRELVEEGFVPTRRLRVNQPPRKDVEENPYIHSLVTYLLSDCPDPEPVPRMNLQDAVRQWRATGAGASPAGEDAPTVLIIDQLEEILIMDPTDWDAKEQFFRELGSLLQRQPVWALLSMREDYMGGLDRYTRLLPGMLHARYRLDYLNGADAKLAMTVPAHDERVEFVDQAADKLVEELRLVEIQRPGRAPETVRAPYIEPFHLQVVCRQMWKKIRAHRGNDFTTITVDDVERYADVDKALTLYVGGTVAGVVKKTRAQERRIRDWLERELITKQNLRGQTLGGPDVADPAGVLRLLEEGYLIRGDFRVQSTWYELSHDRLIRAVQNSNDTWRWDNLEPWQIAAYEWDARDRHPAYLMPASVLPKSLVANNLTDVEKDFIRASGGTKGEAKTYVRIRTLLRALALVAVGQAVAIAVLLIVVLTR